MAGLLRWDWSLLSATVNEHINGFGAAGNGPRRLERGGLEIHAGDGKHVRKGERLCTLYTEVPNREFDPVNSKALAILPRNAAVS